MSETINYEIFGYKTTKYETTFYIQYMLYCIVVILGCYTFIVLFKKFKKKYILEKEYKDEIEWKLNILEEQIILEKQKREIIENKYSYLQRELFNLHK
jgi:hypothetical protein